MNKCFEERDTKERIQNGRVLQRCSENRETSLMVHRVIAPVVMGLETSDPCLPTNLCMCLIAVISL